MKTFLYKSAIACAGIVAACVFMEFVLQVTDPHDYTVAPVDASSGLHIHVPHETYSEHSQCWDNTVAINNLGFHGPDIDLTKKPGVFRIVVLGSSFVEADQIGVGSMFTTVLQGLLNASTSNMSYEVIPLGYSGNGTYLDTLYFERYGAALKPDLVIDLTTDYEHADEFAHADPLFNASGTPDLSLPVHLASNPSAFKTWLHNTYHDSKFAMNIVNRAISEKDMITAFMHSPSLFLSASNDAQALSDATVTPAEASLWDVERRFMAGLADVVHKSGATFVLASWPTNQATTSREALVENSQAVATVKHFAYLDLEPFMLAQAARDGRRVDWSCDEHWSADGHRYAAEALYSYLVAHPALIGRTSSRL